MTDAGNFDAAPLDPTHGSSGPGGPLPGPEIRHPRAESEQPETRHAAADIEHPAWCSPAHCTVTADRNRWHASKPITVRGSQESDLTISVQLFAWPDGNGTYVNIAPSLLDMEGQRHTEEWPVPGELALELGHVLVSLARQVTP